MKKQRIFLGIVVGLLGWLGYTQLSGATPDNDSWIYEEAQTVYLGNLARQEEGIAPLRWNHQLSLGARWFAWDSVENRPEPYCGHQDTNGQWPIDRAVIFGYLGWAGAENAFCGYVTPEQAIQGWLNSPGHRANLLDPNSREIGLGYYQRQSDGRGYVAQAFGTDGVFPPVIINLEALSTTTSEVDLYIYDRRPSGGFTDLGPATQMKVSNNRCLAGAEWEPYQANKNWSLASEAGWQTVYVQTTDEFSRTSTVTDTIYVGPTVPVQELALQQASTTQDEVTLYRVGHETLPLMQVSGNWMVDDTFGSFGLNWGNGERVNDEAAWGGTAFELRPGDGESFAWVYTTDFIKDQPLVAYVRLKVSDNSATGEVARFGVSGGGVQYGPLSIKGTDFTAANQYQEFVLPFTYHHDPEEAFLIFQFWRSGNVNVAVDTVHIFSQPTTITNPYQWDFPGGNYRGQGIWVRYTDGQGNFSPFEIAQTQPGALSSRPMLWSGLVEVDAVPFSTQLQVETPCGTLNWQVSETAAWLTAAQEGDKVVLQIDPAGLAVGLYETEITIEAIDTAGVEPVVVPIQLQVVDQLFQQFLPLLQR